MGYLVFMMDSLCIRDRKRPRLIEVDVPRFPRNLQRRMDRNLERSERLEEGAMRAVDTMPKCDRKRLRIEPNSDHIVKLEAARRQAKRDLQLRLRHDEHKKSLLGENEAVGFWDLVFDIGALASSKRQARAWTMILLHTHALRVRGKGEKTHKDLKRLFDYFVEKGFLSYEKQSRVYRIAPRYSEAIRLMRALESSHLEELLPQQRRPIRER